MVSFYRNLKKGVSKPKALRKAKITYLNNADELTANPYYWAGFVYIGNSSKIYTSYVIYYWLGAALILLILVLSKAYFSQTKR
jgi:hypothetical protein